jgi:hypothetical protein
MKSERNEFFDFLAILIPELIFQNHFIEKGVAMVIWVTSKLAWKSAKNLLCRIKKWLQPIYFIEFALIILSVFRDGESIGIGFERKINFLRYLT